MKNKGTFIFSCVMILAIIVYTLSLCHVRLIRGDYKYRVRAAALPISNAALEALVVEFRGIVADYLLLEAANFIGRPSYDDASPEDWDAVARLLEQSSYLDPYFSQTYRLAQSTLPWHANKIEDTITILKRSKKYRPWDWLPGFFMGFDYYFFLKDNLKASQILMESSQIPGAPLSLATLASRLASQAGQTEVALTFLLALAEKTDDTNVKNIIEKRITALRGVLQIQRAIEKFKQRFGNSPKDLDELVETEMLHGLPDNPYGRPFSYIDGKINY